ncbi:cyclic nucleotide-binding domain-containing protein [Paracoccus sp. M683]|uniref:cyclic nucleotide-binding domain-containing protein n=1 Tax=Paracoccus sp. M683 TaxID=2594268 RepID=UPI00117C9455|nr:cyclic nucleotide-binding domain-containing protein [Paracoccus sp. M683]TRW94303.1 cyclic nucleotide-binding domain-containing protein [Paracoccus sp. M683]
MYWWTRAKRSLGLESKARLPERFSCEEATYEIRRILADNPAINGDAEVMDRFVAEGEVSYFRRGQVLIEQGAQDDNVYFLLSGSVDIVFGNSLGSIREAPNQVGELAATKPGVPRSATVVAHTGEVAALLVSGRTFQQVYNSNNGFRQRLELEKDARFRERIAAGHVAKRHDAWAWPLISCVAAAIAAVVVWGVGNHLLWSQSAALLVTGFSSVLTFILIMILNPAFFWRRCFWAAFIAMITTSWFGRYVLVDIGEGVQLVLGAHAKEVSGLHAVLQMLPFLVVMAICAIRDHAATSRR